MNELLEMIVCVQILADDLHYRASGAAFYGVHLLADKAKDGLDSALDNIREAYWLGELKTLPPATDDTYSGAVARARAIRESYQSGEEETKALAIRLREATGLVANMIETLKREGQMLSGTVAILDGISTQMQVAYGLLDRMVR